MILFLHLLSIILLDIGKHKMAVWQWEIFDSFLNEGHFSLTKAGPLYSPVNKFTLKRDEDLKIFIDTVCDYDATTGSVNYPPGTVRSNIDSIEFEVNLQKGNCIWRSAFDQLKDDES